MIAHEKPSTRRRRAVMRRGAGGALIVAALLGAFPAGAAVIVSSAISNTYGYLADSSDSPPPIQLGGDVEKFAIASSQQNHPSELGVNYTSYANNGGFYFLHQDYCVGTCSTYSQSVVTITLQNTGPEAVSLRFDSLITPGHMSLLNPSPNTFGQFGFRVTQSFDGQESETPLYDANGVVSSEGTYLNTGDVQFSQQQEFSYPASNSSVVDWGATTLSLPLVEIDAGATSYLTYTADYVVHNDSVCDNLFDCSGAEIVFGDPRNDGGVSARSLLQAQPVDIVGEPIIGGAYNPYFVPINIVSADAPAPGDPPGKTTVIYDPLFKSNASAVPEPATWITMVGGFGAAGACLRRRRRIRSAVAAGSI